MLPYQSARYLFAIVVILLIPFVAMQFTDEVDWSLGDFMVAGLMLGGFALFYEVFKSLVPSQKSRNYFIVLLVLIFLLLWAEMAVGIFGSPIAGS